jgi:D-beta-D-heptose 7-phosphate kinase/D-beta-D-heptose 1-phosphate adenosyltransferase
MTKTYSIKSIAKELSKIKGKKIVMVGGSFDILHIGHLRFLENAKKYGDLLVIALNSDSHIKSYKPSSRPIITEWQRAELLKGLKIVDYVFITTKNGLYDPYIYKTIKPHILGLGKEKNRKNSRLRSVAEVKKLYPKLEVVFVSKGAKNISTTIIEQKILKANK